MYRVPVSRINDVRGSASIGFIYIVIPAENDRCRTKLGNVTLCPALLRGAASRPCLESLEERAVPSSLHAGPFAKGPGGTATTVYTESNNPAAGQNAVLAFRQNADGTLTEIGSFNTKGTGQNNFPTIVPGLPLGGLNLGPDDTSSEVVATPNGRFLFAVNQGSNSVSSFRIKPNGALELVGTFASGGVQPDSLGIAGNKLYVSNRGDSTTASPAGTVVPNITGFRIGGNGELRAIRRTTVTFAEGTSPSQNLITPNGRLLFSDVFGVPGGTAAGDNTLAPFRLRATTPCGSPPAATSAYRTVPTRCCSAPPSTRIGPSSTSASPRLTSGRLHLHEIRPAHLRRHRDYPAGGGATCWDSTNGRYLYVTDTVTDSVSVFSLANPLQPVQIQQFALAGPQAPPGSPPGTIESDTFQVALSPNGQTLYVVNHDFGSPTLSFADGNQLHVLSVAANGMLSKPNAPVLLDTAGAVPGDALAKGIAVVVGRGRA